MTNSFDIFGGYGTVQQISLKFFFLGGYGTLRQMTEYLLGGKVPYNKLLRFYFGVYGNLQ